MRFLRLLPFAAAALAVCVVATATATAAVIHTVRRGETLTSVAATDGVSVASLADANGLSPFAELVTGRELIIPPQGGPASAPPATSAPASATAATTAAPSGGGYIVAPGATLTAIAARFGTSVFALAAANGMSPDEILLAGRSLSIPGDQTAASTVSPAVTAEPTAEFVSPSLVGEVAAQDGVAPSLAEAVADEESGFNNDEVSATGAVGVMQIEPYTWRNLTGPGGLALSPDSAADNIRGGVALLRGLLAETGGDEAEAIAGYYQGLRSVRAHGMYADTRRYVADVLALQSRF